MKQIIVICLTISIIIGAYGHSKITTKQPDVAIVLGSATERPADVERKDPIQTTPAPTPTPANYRETGKHSGPTDYDIVMGKKNGPILWKIYALESTRGKADSCRQKGKFNGFGYIPGNCYDFFEEVAYRVDIWFEEKLQTHTLAEALCGYNLGFQNEHLKECINKSPKYPYFRDYENL